MPDVHECYISLHMVHHAFLVLFRILKMANFDENWVTNSKLLISTKMGNFSEKSAIFIKFGGNSYQFYFKILSIYSKFIRVEWTKMYDVYRNSISVFYIRRSWQNYKNFNYRTSIVLSMENSWLKSHRKR